MHRGNRTRPQDTYGFCVSDGDVYNTGISDGCHWQGVRIWRMRIHGKQRHKSKWGKKLQRLMRWRLRDSHIMRRLVTERCPLPLWD